MDLISLRKEIDKIDNQLLDLFLKRMEYVEKISLIKKEENKKILDEGREKEIILRLNKKTFKYNEETEEFFKNILKISKKFQENQIK